MCYRRSSPFRREGAVFQPDILSDTIVPRSDSLHGINPAPTIVRNIASNSLDKVMRSIVYPASRL